MHFWGSLSIGRDQNLASMVNVWSLAKCVGFPIISTYELVQQLGRVDCKGTAKPGEDTYEFHVDFYNYVSLFVRIMSCDSADERRIQLHSTTSQSAESFVAARGLLLLSHCHGEEVRVDN